MKCIIWILPLVLKYAAASRAGITNCTSTSVFGSLSGGTADGVSEPNKFYMMQDPLYQFDCCGVVKSINLQGSAQQLDFYIWRQNGEKDFDIISMQTYDLSLSTTIDENKRASFREGDLFGWKSDPDTVDWVSSSDIHLNWKSDGPVGASVGDSHTWYDETVQTDVKFLIEVTTTVSTAPFFKNLPITLVRTVEDLQFGGVTLMTLSYNDIDPDDSAASDLTVSMEEEWLDLFELDPVSGQKEVKIITKETFTPGVYWPIFRVEEKHCGLAGTATLTLSVIEQAPSITNLPAYTSIHEDDVDEELLYTVTLSDPADQRIWCQGNWSIGIPSVGKDPFIVKMLSTEGGNSEAGIYLIEDPQLDFDIKHHYDLEIECLDSAGTSVIGHFWVNVIENQRPVFSNLGNMVEIDATSVNIGYTVFTVSATDADSDQISYNCTNCDSVPFAVYDSGEVQLTKSLLFTTITSYPLYITASDLRNTSDEKTLIVYVQNTNSDPVFENLNDENITVPENEDLGKSIYQMSASDNDNSDTLTYFMTMEDEEAYDLFELTSTGELRTHSKFNINYDLLTLDTYTLTIYVHDGKKQINDTFKVNVTNKNEPPYFLASEYIVTQSESDAAVEFMDDPGLGTATDPDLRRASNNEILTFSMDCGSYDSYITIDSSYGNLSFPIGYDLDDLSLNLPTYFQCTVFVTDSGNFTDNTTLHVNIEYDNDNPPEIIPSTDTVNLTYDTPMGYFVYEVPATDADQGPNSSLTFRLDPTHDYFVIDSDGVIRTSRNLTSLAGTNETLTAVASDGKNTDATFVLTVIISEIPDETNATTDRNVEFVEDPRNATWLTMSVITMAACLLVITCTLIRCCMQSKINFNLSSLLPKREPRKPVEKKRRSTPLFGKQAEPQYRHVHAKEVLRQSPVSAPTPVEINSLRPGSATSGRVSATDVRVKEASWMDGTSSPVSAAAPMKSVTHARTDDWDYLHPKRTLTTEQMYGEEVVTPTPSTILSKQRRSTAQRMKQAVHIPVSPSPVMFDNVGADDDDFKSERLSIASPSSQLADDEPNY